MIRIAICDDEESWWDLRMARHAEFMKLAVEKQIQRKMQASDLLSASAAKSRLAGMMSSENLHTIFGDEIAGVPTGLFRTTAVHSGGAG